MTILADLLIIPLMLLLASLLAILQVISLGLLKLERSRVVEVLNTLWLEILFLIIVTALLVRCLL